MLALLANTGLKRFEVRADLPLHGRHRQAGWRTYPQYPVQQSQCEPKNGRYRDIRVKQGIDFSTVSVTPPNSSSRRRE